MIHSNSHKFNLLLGNYCQRPARLYDIITEKMKSYNLISKLSNCHYVIIVVLWVVLPDRGRPFPPAMDSVD